MAQWLLFSEARRVLRVHSGVFEALVYIRRHTMSCGVDTERLLLGTQSDWVA